MTHLGTMVHPNGWGVGQGTEVAANSEAGAEDRSQILVRSGWERSVKQREMGLGLSFRKIPWQLWVDGWAEWDGENEPVAREPPGKTGLCPWGWAADADE